MLSFYCFVNAQTTKQISPKEYQQLKDTQKLEKDVFYTFSQTEQTAQKQKPNTTFQIDSAGGQQCSCVVTIDSTFTLVTFGGDSTVNDGQSPLINLPFQFPFYYGMVSNIYINTNGYITPNTGTGAFEYQSLPNTDDGYVIAPFLSNVDLTGPQSGKVYYKVTPHSFIVKWDNVGYFPQHSDKLNTFQLIITDGTDSILPSGNNMAFCYGDMQWTSYGSTGFGGIGASVGINLGDGTTYSLLTKCDTTGINYDGPEGNPDGVDWLDNKAFYINTIVTAKTDAIVYDSLCGMIVPIDTNYNKGYSFYINCMDNGDYITNLGLVKQPAGLNLIETSSNGFYKFVVDFTPTHLGLDTLIIEYIDFKGSIAAKQFMKIFDVQSFIPPLPPPPPPLPCNIIDQSTVPPVDFGGNMTVDDDSKLVNIPFNFTFYDTNYNKFYLNSNGNITFGSQFTGFSATGFPTTGPKMIAPFWADYDNRPSNNGLVKLSVTGTHAIITWDSMGYYNQHNDKRNTCQLIITDGNDPILPPGYNVAFLYEDMGWTTGDASAGTNGFGDSIPSTVGVNRGDGTNFSQITRCGLPGAIYDGPNGNADGVDWLDYRTFYFNIATPTGTSPVGYDSLCQNLIPVFDSLGNPYRVFFNSMDVGDNISYTIIQQPLGSTITPVVVGNTTYLSMDYVPLNTGLDTLIVEYTDNLGSSPTPRQIMRIFDVQSVSPVGIKKLVRSEQIVVFPNPSEGNFTIKLKGNVKMNSVRLFNSIGNELFSANPSQNEFGLNVDHLPKGVYTLNVTDSKGEAHFQKLIIQ